MTTTTAGGTGGSADPVGAPERTAQSRWLTAVGVLSLVVPVVAYFVFIGHFGLNGIWSDQWSDVALLAHAHDGTLGLSTLWAQHTSNRILFPNLLVLVLGWANHLDTLAEEYLSGILLTGTAALVILAHRRRAPGTPWLYYCPVVLLLFTVVGGNPYYGGTNTLWGFTLGLYLTLLSLAAALWLLDRPVLTLPMIVGAVAAGVVGSYSSTQGLLIWPAGLVLLWSRGRRPGAVVAWLVSAVVTAALFLVHYDTAAGMSEPGYLVSHPGASAQFFLFSLGNNLFGQVLTSPPAGVGLVDIAVGLLVVGIALWVAVVYGRRRDHLSASPLGVALVVYGLLFMALVTASRAWQGFFQAGRYASFEVLVWVGCYLAVLGRQRVPSADGRRPLRIASPRPAAVVTAGLLLLVAVQVLVGTPNGVRYAAIDHRHQLEAADVAVNMETADDALVYSSDGGWDPSWVRPLDRAARAQSLSLFDTPLAAELRARGVFPSLQSSLVHPLAGAVVTGPVPLEAVIHVTTPIAGARFEIAGVDGGDRAGRPIVVPGVVTGRRITGTWDSSAASDGYYAVRVTLLHSSGGRATGDPTVVRVHRSSG